MKINGEEKVEKLINSRKVSENVENSKTEVENDEKVGGKCWKLFEKLGKLSDNIQSWLKTV